MLMTGVNGAIEINVYFAVTLLSALMLGVNIYMS